MDPSSWATRNALLFLQSVEGPPERVQHWPDLEPLASMFMVHDEDDRDVSVEAALQLVRDMERQMDEELRNEAFARMLSTQQRLNEKMRAERQSEHKPHSMVDTQDGMVDHVAFLHQQMSEMSGLLVGIQHRLSLQPALPIILGGSIATGALQASTNGVLSISALQGASETAAAALFPALGTWSGQSAAAAPAISHSPPHAQPQLTEQSSSLEHTRMAVASGVGAPVGPIASPVPVSISSSLLGPTHVLPPAPQQPNHEAPSHHANAGEHHPAVVAADEEDIVMHGTQASATLSAVAGARLLTTAATSMQRRGSHAQASESESQVWRHDVGGSIGGSGVEEGECAQVVDDEPAMGVAHHLIQHTPPAHAEAAPAAYTHVQAGGGRRAMEITPGGHAGTGKGQALTASVLAVGMGVAPARLPGASVASIMMNFAATQWPQSQSQLPNQEPLRELGQARYSEPHGCDDGHMGSLGATRDGSIITDTHTHAPADSTCVENSPPHTPAAGDFAIKRKLNGQVVVEALSPMTEIEPSASDALVALGQHRDALAVESMRAREARQRQLVAPPQLGYGQGHDRGESGGGGGGGGQLYNPRGGWDVAIEPSIQSFASTNVSCEAAAVESAARGPLLRPDPRWTQFLLQQTQSRGNTTRVAETEPSTHTRGLAASGATRPPVPAFASTLHGATGEATDIGVVSPHTAGVVAEVNQPRLGPLQRVSHANTTPHSEVTEDTTHPHPPLNETKTYSMLPLVIERAGRDPQTDMSGVSTRLATPGKPALGAGVGVGVGVGLEIGVGLSASRHASGHSFSKPPPPPTTSSAGRGSGSKRQPTAAALSRPTFLLPKAAAASGGAVHRSGPFAQPPPRPAQVPGVGVQQQMTRVTGSEGEGEGGMGAPAAAAAFEGSFGGTFADSAFWKLVESPSCHLRVGAVEDVLIASQHVHVAEGVAVAACVPVPVAGPTSIHMGDAHAMGVLALESELRGGACVHDASEAAAVCVSGNANGLRRTGASAGCDTDPPRTTGAGMTHTPLSTTPTETGAPPSPHAHASLSQPEGSLHPVIATERVPPPVSSLSKGVAERSEALVATSQLVPSQKLQPASSSFIAFAMGFDEPVKRPSSSDSAGGASQGAWLSDVSATRAMQSQPLPVPQVGGSDGQLGGEVGVSGRRQASTRRAPLAGSSPRLTGSQRHTNTHMTRSQPLPHSLPAAAVSPLYQHHDVSIGAGCGVPVDGEGGGDDDGMFSNDAFGQSRTTTMQQQLAAEQTAFAEEMRRAIEAERSRVASADAHHDASLSAQGQPLQGTSVGANGSYGGPWPALGQPQQLEVARVQYNDSERAAGEEPLRVLAYMPDDMDSERL